MIFTETNLKSAFVIDLDAHKDQRGFFARSWCMEEFQKRGLNTNVVQCNISYNENRGTLRGMHYQSAPYEEAKLVRCTMGSVYDVIIDLRRNSPTYKKWFSVELSALNRRAIYIPVGFAHGFQTLEDGTELFYQMSESFHPESAKGVRWNDPIFGIYWPAGQKIISTKDQSFPPWRED